MSKEQKGIWLYFDWIDELDNIEPSEAWGLVVALRDYVKNGTMPNFKGFKQGYFMNIVNQTNRDSIKAKEISEARSIARLGKTKQSSENNDKQTTTNNNKNKQTTTNKTDLDLNQDLNLNHIPPIIPPSPNVEDGDSPPENKKGTKVTKKVIRHKYGEYLNVLLSDEELAKLKAEYPIDWSNRIERLSEYIATRGDKYKNHLAVIRNWDRRDKERAQTAVTDKPKYSNSSADDAMTAALKRTYGG